MINVSVPATSANMGPGFDCFGIALELYLTVCIEKAQTLCFDCCPEEYQNEDNLIYQSFKYIFDKQHHKVPTVCFHIDCEIPTTRGLGSSAACIVAGLFGANAWLGSPYTKDELFVMATHLEGHPDNVAPAIYGGLTASFMDSKVPYVVKFDIDQRFFFGAWIPNFTLSTAKARSVLPKQIQYLDAIYNISRVAVLGKALETYQYDIVSKAMRDRLHQPYRQALIPQYQDIEEYCLHKGALAVYLSGAGPTMMMLAHQQALIETMKQTQPFAPTWKFHSLAIHQTGVQVQEEI